MNLLLIDADPHSSRLISKGLREEGFLVDHVCDGYDGLSIAVSSPFDLIILERNLPSMSGISLLTGLRDADVVAPVLMISAMDRVEHKVEGLNSGADDFLAKPFIFSELLARVQALTRRRQNPLSNQNLRVGELIINTLTQQAYRSGEALSLKSIEYRILVYMAKHAGEVITRTRLLEKIWGYHFDPRTNVVDVHIHNLRKSLDRPFHGSMLETVRGAGYRLKSTCTAP
jgi:two-component system OmpR family response regulator